QDASAPFGGSLKQREHGYGVEGLQDGAVTQSVSLSNRDHTCNLSSAPVPLELKKQLQPVAARKQSRKLGKRGHGGSGKGGGEVTTGIEKLDLRSRKVPHVPMARGGAVKGFIVDDHGNPVLGQDHVHLNPIRTRGNGRSEGGQRVLRGYGLVAAVGHNLDGSVRHGMGLLGAKVLGG